ncbi:MAG: two-component regulator propeller domain-containing protein [Lentimicrobium sp.]
MYKIRPIILLFCISAFCTPVAAQLNPNNLTVYSDLEGAAINDVLTDREGNLWMATQNGLVKYDGYEYKRFYSDPNDSTTLGSILTYRLFEDRKGNIWISSMDMLSEYNPMTKSFKNYTFSHLTDFPIYSQTAIPAISSDLNGRLYFGVASFLGIEANHALIYKDENSPQLKRYELPEGLEIKNIFHSVADKKGNIWLLAINGFFKIDPSGTIQKIKWPLGDFAAENHYNLLLRIGKDGLIWITTRNANLNAWNPETGETKSWSMDKLIDLSNGSYIPNDLKIDQSENIWIASNKGLIFFNRKKEQFDLLEKSPDKKSENENLFCLNIDSFENVWMGTENTGLLRYTNRAILKSFVYKKNDKSSITSGWATKIIETSNGRIWIGTSGGTDVSGLNELNPETQSLTPYPFPEILPGCEFYNVIGEQSPNNILIHTNKGYFLFDTKIKEIKKTNLDPVFDNTHIHNVLTDRSGNLWYCTNNGAYFKARDGKSFHHIELTTMPGSNVTSNEVTNIFESRKHGIWLMTNNGLFLYKPETNQLERHGNDKEKGSIFRSQDINSFYEDKSGITWVGTWGGGLSRYNPETGEIKSYTTSDGLPSMSIQGILADEQNNALWISTFEGISRFSINDEQFNNFSLDDGIQGRLFADGAYLKTSAGLFIFGGNNGITVFNPNDITKNSIPPRVYITGLKIGNTTIETSTVSPLKIDEKLMEEVVLTYSQNNISIDYTGIHYANPSRNLFAYKLENYDNDWRMVGNLRTAYYYNLPPGKYIFRVKAANSNGVWNEGGAGLEIRITPPWWKTWWAYIFYGLLAVAILFLIDRFQRRRLLIRERTLAKEKELEHAREIEKAYHTLKTTQTQLLHSEKMASLGELTAGIAHEIQNPLNFVNNFSEVNTELIDELKAELEVGNHQLAKEIADDIKENEQKINHHGKRADAIVKGMLQHSRSSNGAKEPTDINLLADEYLRLAYHGLRAKDKSFNATMITDFDESIGKINVIPQDLGRVILNLITNAFYAVDEKKKLAPPFPKGGIESPQDYYEPTVTVSTMLVIPPSSGPGVVKITVKDNGNGIPANVLDKIFQPFFTTKPTGEGTGLGLSMSYEIVTKGHGGELKVETREGEGSEFIIVLPV